MLREARVVHDYVQLEFHDNVVLNLNNDLEFDGRCVRANDGTEVLRILCGATVREVVQTSESFSLTFSGDHLLTMSLKPDAWRSPEALAMYVPGEPPVVMTEP